MKPDEELVKFKSGEKVIFQSNFLDRRIMESNHVKEIRKSFEDNCTEVKESFYIRQYDYAYVLKITGIKI